jgi:predicted nucleic acid-binding protein
LPVWVEIKQTSLTADASLSALHDGEKESILLSQEFNADLLLVDDKQARTAAVNLGIAITGTLGILDKAAQAGLIDLKTALDELQKTSFHIADDLVQKLLNDAEKRKHTNREKFLNVVSKVPSVEPDEWDKLD